MSEILTTAPETVAPTMTAPWRGPRVDLTPAVIREDVKVARARGLMLMLGVGAAAVVAGLYVFALGAQTSAQSSLDAATAEQAVLAGQVAALAEVPKTAAELKTSQARLATAMATDVRWSGLLTELAAKTPAGVTARTVAVAPVKEGATTGAAASSGVATLTYAGTASSYPLVASFLDMLARQPGLADAYLLGTTTQTTDGTASGPVTFQASAVVTDEALSHRYDQKPGGAQ